MGDGVVREGVRAWTERNNPDLDSGTWWGQRLRRFGTEKSLDIDIALTVDTELWHGISLVRWRNEPEVKAALLEARRAIRALQDAMIAVWWREKK